MRVFLALFFVCLLSLPAHAADCDGPLRGIFSTSLSFFKRLDFRRKFDLDNFNFLRQQYKIRLSERERIPAPQTPEEKLAYLEAADSLGGVTYAIDNAQTPAQMKALLKIVSKIDFKNGETAERLGALSLRLYKMGFRNQLRLARLLRRDRSGILKSVIQQRVAAEVAKHGMVTAMVNLNLIKDSKSALDFLRGKPNLHSGMLFMALNAPPLVASLFGLTPFSPPLLTPVSMMVRQSLSPQLRDRVLTEGFDSVYEELYSQMGRSAKTDIAYSVGSTVYNMLATVLMVVTMANDPALQMNVRAMVNPNDPEITIYSLQETNLNLLEMQRQTIRDSIDKANAYLATNPSNAAAVIGLRDQLQAQLNQLGT